MFFSWIKAMNSLLKEIIRLLSKEMLNVCLKVMIKSFSGAPANTDVI